MAKNSSGEYMYRLFDFTGGLNTKSNPTLMKDNEASDIINLTYDSEGAVRKRGGRRIHDQYPHRDEVPNAVKIYQTFDLTKSDEDGFTYFIINEDGSFALRNQVDETILYPNNFTATPPNSLFGGFVYDESFYFFNQDFGLFRLNGDNSVDYLNYTNTTFPKCSHAVIKNERAFYMGDPLHPDYVYYSQLGNVESVDLVVNDSVYGGTTPTGGGGIIKLPREDGDVTGLAVFNDALIIFTYETAYSLTGTDPLSDWTLKKLNVTSGCAAPFTLQRANNMLYWLGKDGVQVLTNTNQSVVEANPLSDKIQPNIVDMLKKYQNDGSVIGNLGTKVKLETIKSYYGNNKYYLLDDEGCYVFDETIQVWTKFDFGCKWVVRDNKTEEPVFLNPNGLHYFVLDKTQKKDELTPNTYDPIYGSYSTPHIRLGEPEITKRFKWAKFFFRPNQVRGSMINIKIEIDYLESLKNFKSEYIQLLWGEFDWGDYWGDQKMSLSKLVRFGGVGEMIRFTIYNDRMDEDLELHGIVIGYKKKTKVR